MWLIGFGVAVAFWPGLLSAATVPRWALLAAGLPLVSRLDPRALDPVVAWPMAVLLGWAGLSLCWTPDFLTGAHELFHLLILTGVALAVANAGGPESSLNGAAWGLAVSAVLSIAQVAGWSPVEQTTPPPAGLFYNRDVLAEFAAPLVVWLLANRRFGFAALCAFPLLFCQSRVALVAAGAGCLMILPWRVLVVGAILALIAMLLLGTLPFGLDKFGSASERWAIWSAALSDLQLFGHGLGSFTTTFPKWDYAHGDFFQAIYELGIGAVGFAALSVVVFWRTPSRPERAVLLAIAVEILVAFPFHLPATGFLAMALVGGAGRPGIALCRGGPSCGGETAAGVRWPDQDSRCPHFTG